MPPSTHHPLILLVGRLGKQAIRSVPDHSLTGQATWVISRLPNASADLQQAQRMAQLGSCDCLQDWHEHPRGQCESRPHTFDLSGDVWSQTGPVAERVERVQRHLVALCEGCGLAHVPKGDRYYIADLRARPEGDGADTTATEQPHPLLLTLDRLATAAIKCSPDRSLPGWPIG